MFGNKQKPQSEYEDLVAALLRVQSTRVMIAQESEYRPCYANGKKAIFHRWANIARPQLPRGAEPGENARYYQYRSTQAIVEYEDGTVDRVWPQDIQFADGGKFQEYAWLPMLEQQGGRHGDY